MSFFIIFACSNNTAQKLNSTEKKSKTVLLGNSYSIFKTPMKLILFPEKIIRVERES